MGQPRPISALQGGDFPMSMPLITTKLNIPAPGPGLVSRPRLTARLDENRRLVVLCAPAGSGKTTLLAQWCNCRARVAWVSLDRADSAPERFLAYLIRALQQVAPGVGQGALSLLESGDPAGIIAVPAMLVNDLAGLDHTVVVVLDDYHEIDTPAVHRAVESLLEHLPSQVRLVISAQEEPPLPTARLRVRGQLTELTAQDLRFTDTEAAQLLRGLPDQAVRLLLERTEGWVAGLKLALLSVQGHPDPLAAVSALSGSHRYVFDFLAEEVFHRCPLPVQEFLLHTAILERLSTPLCLAVTGDPHAAERLAEVEKAGLFLVPLDQQRAWYRYHRLFGEFLEALLRRREPHKLPDLHRRAAEWYRSHGDVAGAVTHLLGAGETAGAADLLEGLARDMVARGEISTFLRWLEPLGPEQVAQRPRLGLCQAWALLMSGQVPAAAARLEMLPATEPALAGERAALKASLTLMRGDLAGTVAQGREALAHLPDSEAHMRAMVWLTLGRAAWLGLDTPGAEHAYREAIAFARRGVRPLVASGALFSLGRLIYTTGRLNESVDLFREGLQTAVAMAGPRMPLSALGHLWLAEVLLEQNDLPGARQHAETGLELARLIGSPDSLSHALLTLSQVAAAQGDMQGALAQIDAAASLLRDSAPHLLPRVAVWRAHHLLATGDTAALAQWVQTCDPGAPLGPQNEFERITLGRALVALNRTAEAVRLLEKVEQDAARLGWHCTALRARVPLAVALAAQGDRAGAVARLKASAGLAQTEGFLRTFVEAGTGLLPLFGQAAPAVADRLKAVLGPVLQPDTGPLSSRELEVLRLMALGCNTREIAARLVVTEGTAKWHAHNILAKLEATSRPHALAKARELNLLP